MALTQLTNIPFSKDLAKLWLSFRSDDFTLIIMTSVQTIRNKVGNLTLFKGNPKIFNVDWNIVDREAICLNIESFWITETLIAFYSNTISYFDTIFTFNNLSSQSEWFRFSSISKHCVTSWYETSNITLFVECNRTSVIWLKSQITNLSNTKIPIKLLCDD